MTVVSVTTNSNGCHICGQSVTFTPLDAFTLLTLLPRLELLPHWLMNREIKGQSQHVPMIFPTHSISFEVARAYTTLAQRQSKTSLKRKLILKYL